jgi:RNA-binding protein 5/10
MTTKSLASTVLLDDAGDDEETHAEPSKPMPVKRVAPLMSSKKVRGLRL